jgi:hypothetical protein
VGEAAQDHGGLPAADTLLTFLAACDALLADEEWLATHPDHWGDDLRAMRGGLHAQLDRHAERYAPRDPGESA